MVFAIFVSNFFAKPFRKMTKSIEEIQIGYGEDMLMIDDFTETEEISANINAMLKNMKVLDESRQEFVSNVSHELKTPLTSMKVLARNPGTFLSKKYLVRIGATIRIPM